MKLLTAQPGHHLSTSWVSRPLEADHLLSRTQAQSNLEAVYTGNSITTALTAAMATPQGLRRLGFPTRLAQPLMT